MKRLPLLFLVACLLAVAPAPASSQTGDPSCQSHYWDEFYGCVLEEIESVPFPYNCTAQLNAAGFTGLSYIAHCAPELPDFLEPAFFARECHDVGGRDGYEACVRENIEGGMICVMFSTAGQLGRSA